MISPSAPGDRTSRHVGLSAAIAIDPVLEHCYEVHIVHQDQYGLGFRCAFPPMEKCLLTLK